MPTAASLTYGELLCLVGGAGSGKSSFAVQAPQPHAVLCADKPVLAMPPPGFPGYDPNLSFGKFYPPPQKDLTNDKELPSRNIFDQLIRDVQALKVGLYKGQDKFEIGEEVWEQPKSIIIEGMDFIRDHAVNWVLNTQNKPHMDDFKSANGNPNPFLGWGLVSAKMEEFFMNLAFLPSVRPVNVIVTIGVAEETKREKVGGKIEMNKTGIYDPAFGGKMAQEAPRQFKDCWLAMQAGGRYYVVVEQTTKYAQYRGLRSGRFWPAGVVNGGLVDVTLDQAKMVNHWARLFGSAK